MPATRLPRCAEGSAATDDAASSCRTSRVARHRAVLVIGTFAVDLSMLAAVIGHEGSEVLIIANGLRVALR